MKGTSLQPPKGIIRTTYLKWTNYLQDNLPKHTQGEKDKLNRLISIKEVESIINNLPKEKAHVPDEITDDFYQTLKEDFIPII